MKTGLQILRVGHERETREADLAAEPGFNELNRLILPLLEGAENMEHVSVLFDGWPADMFVDEEGAVPTRSRGPLPVNRAATEIYHAASLRRDPNADTSEWPRIHGTAVLFARRVWF
jgi:hypothetical protein